MTDKVQKIREEVEKLKSQLIKGACASQIAMETYCKEEAYNEVFAILDSLQEEPVSEDLERASERAAVEAFFVSPQWIAVGKELFKDGAKWQKEKDVKILEFVITNGKDYPTLDSFLNTFKIMQYGKIKM